MIAIKPAADYLLDTQSEYGSSRFSTHRRCQREHHLRYTQGLRRKPRDRDPGYEPTKPDPRATGQLIHAVLAYVQDRAAAGAPTGDWRSVILAAAQTPNRFSQLDCDETERVLSFYFLQHGAETGGWPEGAKIIATERMYREDKLFSLPYTARADSVLEIEDRIVIADHKSRSARRWTDKSELSRSDVIAGLATHEQFIGLSMLVSHTMGLDYYPPILVNDLVKTKTPSFDRWLVPITDRAVEMWGRNHSRLADRGLAGDCMNYSACAPDFGSRCDYFGYCHGSDEQKVLHYHVPQERLAAREKEENP